MLMWCPRRVGRSVQLRSRRRQPPSRLVTATAALLNTATVIDGKAIGAEIRAGVKLDADALIATGAHPPGLAVVLVGARPDSATYVGMKKKAAAEAGFHSVTKELPADVEQSELLRTVQQLNNDPAIDGILVQVRARLRRMDSHDTPQHVRCSCRFRNISSSR